MPKKKFKQHQFLPLLALPIAILAVRTAAAQSYLSGNVEISESLSYIPSNASVNLLDLGTAKQPGLVSTSRVTFSDPGSKAVNTIDFSGASGVYQGSQSGVAAAPWTAGGAEKTNYLAAEPNGSVTINYANSQKYFGLLWGSVDKYNSLDFYNNGKLVDTITGSQIQANANGNQTAAGSDIVNVNFLNGASYNKVVATSSSPAFEFDTIAYANTNVAITPAAIAAAGDQGSITKVTTSLAPNPAPLPALAASPLGVAVVVGGAGMLFRRRRA